MKLRYGLILLDALDVIDLLLEVLARWLPHLVMCSASARQRSRDTRSRPERGTHSPVNLSQSNTRVEREMKFEATLVGGGHNMKYLVSRSTARAAWFLWLTAMVTACGSSPQSSVPDSSATAAMDAAITPAGIDMAVPIDAAAPPDKSDSSPPDFADSQMTTLDLSSDGVLHVAYIINQIDNNVSQYTIGSDGTLAPLSPPTVAATAPASVAIDPSGHHAYVTNNPDSLNPGFVSQYSIGPNGALAPMTPATVATGRVPASIAVDPSGRYVYIVNLNDADVSQYTIGATGALTAMTPPTVPCGLNPFKIAIDPLGRFAYVVNNLDKSVSQYKIGASGALTSITADITTGSASSPWSLAIDASGSNLYVTNSVYSGTVLQFGIGVTGALSPLTPAKVAAGNSPQGIATDPGANYLYVTNSALSDNTVSQYLIGTGGTLAPLASPTIPTGTNSSSVAIDRSGRHVYVVNTGTGAAPGTISQYAIGPSGALSALTPGTVTAGVGPRGIAVW